MQRIEVPPTGVAATFARLRRRRSGWIAGQPVFNVPDIDLFAPQKTREGLALDAALILRQMLHAESVRIELVRLRPAKGEDVSSIVERVGDG